VTGVGERDVVAQTIETTALAGVLFFSDRGRAYRATVHELPKDRLTAAQNLFQLGDGEKVVAVLDARLHEDHPNLVFLTASGGVKRRLRRVPGGSGVLVRTKMPIALMSVMYAKRKVSSAR
jgi:DNA gyrase/topoisomerase IV subunit A